MDEARVMEIMQILFRMRGRANEIASRLAREKILQHSPIIIMSLAAFR